MKQKPWLHNIGCKAVVRPRFGGTLPATEEAVPDPTQPSEQAQQVTLNQNYKEVKRRMLSFETQEMMNNITEEQDHDQDWSGGKFIRILTIIGEDVKPNDTMVEFELDEDLRSITLSGNKDL